MLDITADPIADVNQGLAAHRDPTTEGARPPPPAEAELSPECLRTVAAQLARSDSPAVAMIARYYLADHPPAAPPSGELSEREVVVVRLIARGYSNKEISAQMKLSVKTVETYKARAMEKLDIRTRVGLVQYAVRQGWLTPVAMAGETGDGPTAVPPGQCRVVVPSDRPGES